MGCTFQLVYIDVIYWLFAVPIGLHVLRGAPVFTVIMYLEEPLCIYCDNVLRGAPVYTVIMYLEEPPVYLL